MEDWTLDYFKIALPLLVAAYLLGSIPFGLLLTRLAGLGDVRAIGSGNIGATNVLRTGNKKLAALTLLLDGLKGAAAVLLLSRIPAHFNLMPPSAGLGIWAAWAALPAAFGAMAILGHIYPVWLRFKGGKGVATYLGVVAALEPLLAISFAAVWLGVFKSSRISSLSALTAAFTVGLLAIILFFLTGGIVALQDPLTLAHKAPPLLCVIAGSAMLFYTHRANIERLKNGAEPSFGKVKVEADEDEVEAA